MRSKKRWVWLAIGLSVVGAALVLIAVLVIRELDVERQERRIAHLATEFTGRQVEILGGLEIGFSWRPTVIAKDVHIANAAWGSDPTMLSADRVEVSLSLERLLSSRSIDFVRIALSGVYLLLETDARGRRNWDLDTAGSEGGVAESAHDVFPESVVIKDLDLHIRGPDSAGAAPIAVSRVSLEAKTRAQPLKLELRARPAGTEFSAVGTIGSFEDWLQGSRLPISLDLHWGISQFSTDATLEFGERPRLEGRILSGNVDLGEWVSARSEPATTGGRLFSSAPLGLAHLVSSNAEISLVVEKVVDERAHLEIRHAEVALKGGVLRVDSAKVFLSGAKADASLQIDGRGTAPRVRFFVLARQLDLGELLGRLGVTDEIEAVVDLRVKVRGTGDSVAALLGTLDGDLAYSVTRGQIPTAYFGRLVSDLPSLVIPWAQPRPRVDLECAGARFSILRGVARTQDMMFDTSRLTIRAEGEVDLGTETLSFTLAPRPRDHKLLSVATDISLSGPLRNPSAFPRPVDVLGSAARLALGPVRMLNPFPGADATRRAECTEHTQGLVESGSSGE